MAAVKIDCSTRPPFRFCMNYMLTFPPNDPSESGAQISEIRRMGRWRDRGGGIEVKSSSTKVLASILAL